MTTRSLGGALRLGLWCLTGLTLVRLAVAWSTDAELDHASGVWLAHATDLRDGVFYRPLAGDGYGGSLYFPLPFVLLAALLRLGADPRWANYGLALASGLLLVAGVYALLRRLGAQRGVAGACAGLVLGAESMQFGLHAFRGDVLPTALVVWALRGCVGLEASWRRAAWPALSCTLAFAAKLTAAYGAVAALGWLLVCGRRQAALRLAVLSVTGGLGVLALMYWASDGRVVEVLWGSRAAGPTLIALRTSSVVLLRRLFVHNPDSATVVLLGVLTAIAAGGSPRERLGILFLVAAGLTGVVIFAAPGAESNHLVDLHVASLVVLGVGLTGSRDEGVSRLLVAALLVAAVVSLQSSLLAFWYLDRIPRRPQHLEAVRIMRGSGPILAENPWLPILVGQRPYVLDPFMLRILAARDPRIGGGLTGDVRARRFSWIALQHDPGTPDGRTFLLELHFGREFVAALDEAYDKAVTLGPDAVLYRPRGQR